MYAEEGLHYECLKGEAWIKSPLGAGKEWCRAERIIWSSEYRFMADALELSGEEGRDKLRKAGVRSTYPVTPGCPNGVIRQFTATRMHEYIVHGSDTE